MLRWPSWRGKEAQCALSPPLHYHWRRAGEAPAGEAPACLEAGVASARRGFEP